MTLQKINTVSGQGFWATYQRQGNDKNGNPIYIINIFEDGIDNTFYNRNYMQKRYKLDKHGNIKTTSYNIDDTIEHIIVSMA